jgi:hypothetical protein
MQVGSALGAYLLYLVLKYLLYWSLLLVLKYLL